MAMDKIRISIAHNSTIKYKLIFSKTYGIILNNILCKNNYSNTFNKYMGMQNQYLFKIHYALSHVGVTR